MNSRMILAILVGGLTLTGCSKRGSDPEYTGTSTFPLTTESRWEYTKTTYRIPFNDPAYSDTGSYSIIRRVIGPDTTIDSLNLIIVDDSTSVLDSSETNPYVNRHWYQISDEDLQDYGSQVLHLWGPDKRETFDPPHLLLDFPLMANKAWTESTEDLASVFSTVVGTEYISVGEEEIKCDVIRSRMIDEQTGHLYYDSYWWYSDDGLIRNEFDFGVGEILDESGNLIDSVRTIRKLELLNFEIQPG